MSKSNVLRLGEKELLNGTVCQTTSPGPKPSFFATAYATADSNPLPFAGLSSWNQGAYAGLSVPIVSFPEIFVGCLPGVQVAFLKGDLSAAVGPGCGAQPEAAASRTTAGTAVTRSTRVVRCMSGD